MFIISDLHLGGRPDERDGAGRVVSGFQFCHAYRELIEFIDWVALGESPTAGEERQLVINGDIVDFLADDDHGAQVWTADEATALSKLDRIAARTRVDGRRGVFEALADLAGRHRLTLLIGNHDVEPPHMVVAAGADSRFFARSGPRKEPLDVRQIRAAFALSQELPDRIRRFRDERLGRIVSDEIPVPLASKRRVVVHLIPISSMDPGVVRDIAPAAAAKREKFRPIDGNGPNRFNIDGFLTWSTHPRTNDPSGYVQVFRNGTIEIVDGQSVSLVDGVPTLASVAFPRSLVRALSHYMDGLKELEIDPPIMALVSMTGAKGVEIYVGPQSAYASQVVPIDRDTLLLPDVLFESYVTSSFLGLSSDTMETRLRPVLDALWQACGMPQFFDEDRRRR